MVGFFLQADSQAARAAVSIISLQNWPQARFVRFQRNPQQEKAKVVRPEQIPVVIFPQKPHPEARQTTEMRYNYLKLDLVVYRVGERSRTNPTSKLWEKKCIQEQKKSAFSQKTP